MRSSRGGARRLRVGAARIGDGLFGPSGCGKTTIMRAIVGVQVLAGRPGHRARRRRRDPGAAPARRLCDPGAVVYGDLSINENLRNFAAIVDAPAKRIDEIVATVDLLVARAQLVASLSGGRRSRVSPATAGALALGTITLRRRTP